MLAIHGVEPTWISSNGTWTGLFPFLLFPFKLIWNFILCLFELHKSYKLGHHGCVISIVRTADAIVTRNRFFCYYASDASSDAEMDSRDEGATDLTILKPSLLWGVISAKWISTFKFYHAILLCCHSIFLGILLCTATVYLYLKSTVNSQKCSNQRCSILGSVYLKSTVNLQKYCNQCCSILGSVYLKYPVN